MLKAARQLWSSGGFLSYLGVILLFMLSGAYLVVDFRQERSRILADHGQLAAHKAELVSRSFGDTFLVADYLLRDVISRVDIATDLSYPPKAPAATARLKAMLREKAETVSGVSDLVLISKECVFSAVSHHAFEGRKSIQSFCQAPTVAPGQSVHFEYMPVHRSQSRHPVVLMSRVLGSPEGRLLGAVMAVIDLDYAQTWLASLKLEHGDILAILDREGVLLARSPSLPASQTDTPQLKAKRAEVAAIAETTHFQTAAAGDGRDRTAGVAPVDRLPFVSVVGYDTERILQGWASRAWQFAVGYAVLFILALVALRGHLMALKQKETLRLLANTDALTGIANRRYFLESSAREFLRAQRYQRPLCLLMVDIDKFKLVNDRWGHPTGDRVIQALAAAMQVNVRQNDVAARLGGEEFAILLPETDLSGAQVIAERLRAGVEKDKTPTTDDGTAVGYTVSIGVAALNAGDASFDALLGRADQALYQAKERGRNRVVAETAAH